MARCIGHERRHLDYMDEQTVGLILLGLIPMGLMKSLCGLLLPMSMVWAAIGRRHRDSDGIGSAIGHVMRPEFLPDRTGDNGLTSRPYYSHSTADVHVTLHALRHGNNEALNNEAE